MGRYYTGDITGKFWFAIQNSDDADHFGCKGIVNNYRFYGCDCTISTFVINICEQTNQLLFCNVCYSSPKEHKNDVKDLINEDLITDDKNETKLYYECAEQLIYEFNNTHIDTVKFVLNDLENTYSKYIKSFEIIDDPSIENGIDYDIELNEDKYKDETDDVTILEYIARLCLGRQILYCLEKNGKCNFTAEI
jgi:hypothetical protein